MERTLLSLLLVVAIVSPAHAFRNHYRQHGRHAFTSSAIDDMIPKPLSTTNSIRGSPMPGEYVVTDYGAVGDNSTDNTAAFAKALAAANDTAGGIVFVPPGSYRFTGQLVIPTAVTLQGSFTTVPSHDAKAGHYPVDGTVLIPLADRNNEAGKPFITVGRDSTLAGVVIWHVEQGRFEPPVPYPFAVALVDENAAVKDVEILNSWNGISAVAAHRHYIARIQGQPINIGVYIDETYDIGRIEDVHFNPWWSSDVNFMYWQTTFGRSFVMGRSDWEYVFNTFSFAYAIGYHFVETSTGSMNGNFLGIGTDYACNASVQVDASQLAGLLITNGEFTAFHNTLEQHPQRLDLIAFDACDNTQVVVGKDNTGPVNFVDCSFWGPANHIARLAGNGVTTFNSCEFNGWDYLNTNQSAIYASGGTLIVQGTNFNENKPQVELEATVDKVIFLGNVGVGSENIINHGVKQVQSGFNAFD
ncbi:uncharacterized protein MONBRDRAFT_24025 [Monosiga brevicollis MX1]|uniref:Rhamnogalacturonase A/B/Epimerase-like pectate lyase domain-containing protein n=1 Tax=Monosiga brevicollis TaxID=81824 RepID=A9UUH3_MONBE|nr:uncharacterized protein MONBRDRAFT_24025 [Monosiga brevicollis MX1]EDQ90902.1 predicted protein [Monosiga brevicollis MX1]|eukprot:XP_001744199.1 hypothetical protein [Monosiga brevicollis MX1]